MNLGRYQIESYSVNIGGSTQSRQKITYIGNNGVDFFIERYYGQIRLGYLSNNMKFENLLWTNIKTHIVGESILVDGEDSLPQIYISLSTISTVDKISDISLVVIDSQYDPITLEFRTEFDCNQALSVLTSVIEDPFININDLVVDDSSPVIYLNEFFYDGVINMLGSLDPGPHTSLDDTDFEVDVNSGDITGGLPLAKSDIIDGIVERIEDNRGSISYGDSDLTIYQGTIGGTQSNTITSVGTWWVKLIVGDSAENLTEINVNINII